MNHYPELKGEEDFLTVSVFQESRTPGKPTVFTSLWKCAFLYCTAVCLVFLLPESHAAVTPTPHQPCSLSPAPQAHADSRALAFAGTLPGVLHSSDPRPHPPSTISLKCPLPVRSPLPRSRLPSLLYSSL